MKFLIYLLVFVFVLVAGGFLYIALSDVTPEQHEVIKEIKPQG
jgi:zinc transporter ZupT